MRIGNLFIKNKISIGSGNDNILLNFLMFEEYGGSYRLYKIRKYYNIAPIKYIDDFSQNKKCSVGFSFSPSHYTLYREKINENF